MRVVRTARFSSRSLVSESPPLVVLEVLCVVREGYRRGDHGRLPNGSGVVHHSAPLM